MEVAMSFLLSLRFLLTSTNRSGSKNASSMAYVHVPRSRRPKRLAGLSMSFSGRFFSINVSSLMFTFFFIRDTAVFRYTAGSIEP